MTQEFPPVSSPAVPNPAAAAAAVAPPPPKRRLAMTLLPFAPIILALATAFAARQFFKPAPPIPIGALLGMKAPDFALQDAHKADNAPPVKLSLLVNKSPVLLVFHMGYGCKRCLLYLDALAELNQDFQQAHTQVVAISSWPTDATRDAARDYGDFPYPLLSDPDSTIADAYGLYDEAGNALYGLFLVDSQQRIVYAQRTTTPYDEFNDILRAVQTLSQK